jgi:hypothetical protein
VRKQRGDVDELLERARTQNAGAAEESFDGGVGSRECGGVRARRAGAGVGRARLQREQRLPARDAMGNPAELLRVPERLEIEKTTSVPRPPPHQQVVVRRDVGLVADRDNAEKPSPRSDAARASRTKRAALRRMMRRGWRGREGRVQADSRNAIGQFGPMSRAPCARTAAAAPALDAFRPFRQPRGMA